MDRSPTDEDQTNRGETLDGDGLIPKPPTQRLLELFKGTGSVGRVFEANGFHVVSLDNDPQSETDSLKIERVKKKKWVVRTLSPIKCRYSGRHFKMGTGP